MVEIESVDNVRLGKYHKQLVEKVCRNLGVTYCKVKIIKTRDIFEPNFKLITEDGEIPMKLYFSRAKIIVVHLPAFINYASKWKEIMEIYVTGE